MIPVLGTGGPGFNSRIAPFFNALATRFYRSCHYSGDTGLALPDNAGLALPDNARITLP